MSKAKITKIAICLVLILVLAGGGIVYYNVAVKDDGAVTNQAASRGEGVPDDLSRKGVQKTLSIRLLFYS